MNAMDDFSTYSAELLEGTCDCVDRIVLNAYFAMGQTGGGLRTWSRQWRGDDTQLGDDHLREQVIKPLLAGAGHRLGRPPKIVAPLDQH
jgi:hypothetical protein